MAAMEKIKQLRDRAVENGGKAIRKSVRGLHRRTTGNALDYAKGVYSDTTRAADHFVNLPAKSIEKDLVGPFLAPLVVPLAAVHSLIVRGIDATQRVASGVKVLH